MGALIPIEPDHLCSLIALNAGTRKPWPAFLGGMSWGLGHSVGMLVFCCIFLPLESLVNVEVWEYYGSYVAGLLLCAIGLYFLWNELKYLETTDDGSWVPKADACCACHSHPVYSPQVRSLHPGHGCCPTSNSGCNHSHDELDVETEKAPLIPAQDKHGPSVPEEAKASKRSWEDFKGALVGLLQGLCCPSCIAGVAFVCQMGAQRHTTLDTVCFFVVCFVSIVLSSGCVSALCVLLGGYCGTYLSFGTRTLYRSACIFSVVVGVVWIVLNAFGKLHVIDYTHGLEHQLHTMASGRTAEGVALMMAHGDMK